MLRQLQRRIQIDLKSVQVAIVNANQIAACIERALQLVAIVNLAEDVQVQLRRAARKIDQLALFQRRYDEQHRVSPARSRFQQLKFVDDEILTQAWQPGRVRCCPQIL